MIEALMLWVGAKVHMGMVLGCVVEGIKFRWSYVVVN